SQASSLPLWKNGLNQSDGMRLTNEITCATFQCFSVGQNFEITSQAIRSTKSNGHRLNEQFRRYSLWMKRGDCFERLTLIKSCVFCRCTQSAFSPVFGLKNWSL